MMKLDRILLLLILSTINTIVIADKTCDGDSCKKHTESSATCDEDGDEPCFFEDEEDDEDASKPVLLRDSDDGYPLFEKLTRPENIKVCIFNVELKHISQFQVKSLYFIFIFTIRNKSNIRT